MKVYAQLVALACAFQPWGTAAFAIVPPAPKASFALHATPAFKSTWELGSICPPKRIEGQTRHTWNFNDISKEVVQVAMNSGGRPMSAEVELWIGPDWTPMTMKTYSEDGRLLPVQTLVGTRNKFAQVEIRNTGPYEFPLNAAAEYAKPPLSDIRKKIPETSKGRYIEGGAVYSDYYDPDVEQIQVFLNTDARQLNAKVELLNGPNNVKQAYEIFTNNGLLNSLYVVFNAPPGSGNTIRITNLAPVEFPCIAYIAAV